MFKKEENNPKIPPIGGKDINNETFIELDPQYKEDRIFDEEVANKVKEAYERFSRGENVVSIKKWSETVPYNVSTNEIRKCLNLYDFPILSLYKDASAFVDDLEKAYRLLIRDKLSDGFGARLQKKATKEKNKQEEGEE